MDCGQECVDRVLFMDEPYVRLRSPDNTYKSVLREKWLCKTGDYWVVVNNIGCDTSCGAFAYAHDPSTCPEKVDSSKWRVWGNDDSNKEKFDQISLILITRFELLKSKT